MTRNSVVITNKWLWNFRVLQNNILSFDKTINLPFENLSLPAPEKFDTILTQFYGDYMTLPPEEKRFYSHEFHAYKLED